MLVYWDTSAVAKLYLEESGSRLARRMAAERRVVSGAVLLVEMESLLRRARDEGRMEAEAWRAAVERLEYESEEWELMGLDAAVLQEARRAVRQTGVRALDGIHLGCALQMRETGVAVQLLSADRRQMEAARALGLAVQPII